MDQDVDLLAQRVEKQRAKLDEEATLLDMTEKRVTAAESDRQSAAREAERLKTRAKKAKRDARRLSSEAKRAQVRLEAIDSDHAQAVKEAKSRGKSVAKRQQKLAEAEGAHAAAQAGDQQCRKAVEHPPPRTVVSHLGREEDGDPPQAGRVLDDTEADDQGLSPADDRQEDRLGVVGRRRHHRCP